MVCSCGVGSQDFYWVVRLRLGFYTQRCVEGVDRGKDSGFAMQHTHALAHQAAFDVALAVVAGDFFELCRCQDAFVHGRWSGLSIVSTGDYGQFIAVSASPGTTPFALTAAVSPLIIVLLREVG